jgi:hypothetical protein
VFEHFERASKLLLEFNVSAFEAQDIVTIVKIECNVVTGYKELGLILGIIMFLYLYSCKYNGIMGLDVCRSVVYKLGWLKSINRK